MKTTKTKASSKFHLNEDEIQNLKGRDKFRGYILDLVQRDIQMYLYSVILLRLGLQGKSVKLSEDFEWVEVMEEKPVIFKPNGEAINGKK